MANRADWENLRIQLEDVGIDIDEIKRNALLFYNLVDSIHNQDKYKYIMILIKSEMYCNACRRLIKNKISPEENKYISQELKESYYWLVDNLGRVELQLKKMKDGVVSHMETSYLHFEKFSALVKTAIYTHYMQELMNHLAYYPLKNAYDAIMKEGVVFVLKDKYNKKARQNFIKKDKDLYWYLVFLQFFYSSETLGALTGQEFKSVPKSLGIVNQVPTRSYKNLQKEDKSPEGDGELSNLYEEDAGVDSEEEHDEEDSEDV